VFLLGTFVQTQKNVFGCGCGCWYMFAELSDPKIEMNRKTYLIKKG